MTCCSYTGAPWIWGREAVYNLTIKAQSSPVLCLCKATFTRFLSLSLPPPPPTALRWGRKAGVASPFFRVGCGSSDALPWEWALVENSLDIFHTITLPFFLPESVGVCFCFFHWDNLVGFLELKPRRRELGLGLGHSGLSTSPACQTLTACQTLNLGCLFPEAHHQRSLGLSCWLEKEMATRSSIFA